MALTAKEMNKPFYVVAESFKFARLYPLNQTDVPNHFKVIVVTSSVKLEYLFFTQKRTFGAMHIFYLFIFPHYVTVPSFKTRVRHRSEP